jgi:O-6-methylguanine DNA methyltransferase
MAQTFTEKVLAVTRRIAIGQTLSYREVAKLAGSPEAYRAVGNILRRNFDPAIPCHRVVCSNGRVGGFNRGGSEAKASLLVKEKRAAQNDRLRFDNG